MTNGGEESNRLPTGWAWATLPQLGELNRGKSKHRPRNDPKLYGGIYPFIQTGDIKDASGVIRKYRQTYNEEGLKQSHLWRHGTLCITIAANIAETAILGFDACFPDSVVGFQTDPSCCNIKYVEFFLRSAKDDIQRYAPATAQKNINLEILSKVSVPLPPLAEQHRIVSKTEELFTKLDAGVEELKKAKVQLRRYRRSVLEAAVTGELTQQWRNKHKGKIEPAELLLSRILQVRKEQWEAHRVAQQDTKGKKRQNQEPTSKYEQPKAPTTELNLPAGWCVATTDQVFYYVTSGSRNWAKYYSDSGAVFLRIGNLEHYDIDLDLRSVQHVLPMDGTEGARTRLTPNDILVSITADVGMVGLVPPALGEAYINQHIALARPVKNVNPKFMAWLLSSDFGQRQLRNLQRGATKVGLGLDDMRAINFGLPPLEEQAEIVAEIERHLSIMQYLNSSLEDCSKESRHLRQSILSDAFRGKLIPQDPTDEPAEKLLERIKQTASSDTPRKRRRKPTGANQNGN